MIVFIMYLSGVMIVFGFLAVAFLMHREERLKEKSEAVRRIDVYIKNGNFQKAGELIDKYKSFNINRLI